MTATGKLSVLLDDPEVHELIFGLAHVGSAASSVEPGASRLRAVVLYLAHTTEPEQYGSWLSDDASNQAMTLSPRSSLSRTSSVPGPSDRHSFQRRGEVMKPTVVLVHGAFAESASWNGVVERLAAAGVDAVAVANPLRGLAGDAAYVRDVLAALDGPVVLVGHSYGGMVATEAAAGLDAVAGLVYVCGFAPDHGESAFELSTRFPGSTLGEALAAYPVTANGNEFAIRRDVFHHQFCADVPATDAALMAATQRPVTEAALSTGLPTDRPAWRTIPSWFVFGELDRCIPAALHRFMAERAGAKAVREIAGASHALSVSEPGVVADTILEAAAVSP
jgi:pimeloyl-ACP methyl ester carboxylesterase